MVQSTSISCCRDSVYQSIPGRYIHVYALLKALAIGWYLHAGYLNSEILTKFSRYIRTIYCRATNSPYLGIGRHLLHFIFTLCRNLSKMRGGGHLYSAVIQYCVLNSLKLPCISLKSCILIHKCMWVLSLSLSLSSP